MIVSDATVNCSNLASFLSFSVSSVRYLNQCLPPVSSTLQQASAFRVPKSYSKRLQLSFYYRSIESSSREGRISHRRSKACNIHSSFSSSYYSYSTLIAFRSFGIFTSSNIIGDSRSGSIGCPSLIASLIMFMWLGSFWNPTALNMPVPWPV